MTDDRREHSFDERLKGDHHDFDEVTLPPAGSAEHVELERLAESLALLRSGRSPRLDRLEDPELASLLDVVAAVEAPLRTSTETRPFRSFRKRSRAAILHELDQERRAAGEASGSVLLAFLRRPLFAPAAAAAAAAAIVIAVVSTSGVLPIIGQNDSSQVVSNRTQQFTTLELERISTALETIQDRTEKGEFIPAPTFREVSESAARFANLIERDPGAVEREAVETFAQAMRTGQSVLESARAEPEAEGALASAQRATRDGDVVASRVLEADDEQPVEEPSPTGTPEPTETPVPTPTETATPDPTPEEGGEDETDDAAGDDGANGAPAEEPTPTPQPDETVTP